jgi:hypothetical protein
MTKQQADKIYALTSSTNWQAFEEVLNERLGLLQTELESCNADRLPKIQGNIEQIRFNLNVRTLAEELLEK